MTIHKFFARKIWSRIALIAIIFSVMIAGSSCAVREKGKKDIRNEVQEILNQDFSRGDYKKAVKKLKSF